MMSTDNGERMFRVGDRVRVTCGWEPHLQDQGPEIGAEGVIEGTVTDDFGATPQEPGLLVSGGIGLMWPEELELV